MTKATFFPLAATLCLAIGLHAQDNNTDRVVVPFSDPGGPKRLSCNIVNGSITIKAYNGKEVIVEAKGRGARPPRREPPAGMRRVGGDASGLNVEESGNQVKVNVFPGRTSEVTIQVPVDTSVNASTNNGGDILVEGVRGEVDVNNLNGNVTVRDVSGAVVAHSLNGKVIVSVNSLTAGKAMSFSTLNGEVDVTLPADTKADLKMKAHHGEIFSDFDITLKANPSQPVQEGRSKDKKTYRVQFDRTMYGTINGGGPEMQFTTLNGTIYVRKKK